MRMNVGAVHNFIESTAGVFVVRIRILQFL